MSNEMKNELGDIARVRETIERMNGTGRFRYIDGFGLYSAGYSFGCSADEFTEEWRRRDVLMAGDLLILKVIIENMWLDFYGLLWNLKRAKDSGKNVILDEGHVRERMKYFGRLGLIAIKQHKENPRSKIGAPCQGGNLRDCMCLTPRGITFLRQQLDLKQLRPNVYAEVMGEVSVFRILTGDFVMRRLTEMAEAGGHKIKQRGCRQVFWTKGGAMERVYGAVFTEDGSRITIESISTHCNTRVQDKEDIEGMFAGRLEFYRDYATRGRDKEYLVVAIEDKASLKMVMRVIGENLEDMLDHVYITSDGALSRSLETEDDPQFLKSFLQVKKVIRNGEVDWQPKSVERLEFFEKKNKDNTSS